MNRYDNLQRRLDEAMRSSPAEQVGLVRAVTSAVVFGSDVVPDVRDHDDDAGHHAMTFAKVALQLRVRRPGRQPGPTVAELHDLIEREFPRDWTPDAMASAIALGARVRAMLAEDHTP